MKTNEQIINNIKEWFNKNNIKTAIINISGGADSTYVAYALVKALGKENVIGLLQPNGEQKDIGYAEEVVKLLGIHWDSINIKDTYNIGESVIKDIGYVLNRDTDNRYILDNECAKINIAPRIRMMYAYAIANLVHGAVVGTGNASERYVGYFTKWGDGACDFNPIKDILKTDLIQMGLELGIPEHLIKKTPADGLTDKTDEEKYGFSYQVLDDYIRTGICEDYKVKEKIDRMHRNSRHKFEEI